MALYITTIILWLDYLTTHTSLSPIWRGFASGFVNYKKGCTQLAATSDKVYQLLAHGRWFSPGTTTSFITKTGCHDIAEILLKVALNTKNQIILWYVQVCVVFFQLNTHSFYTITAVCEISSRPIDNVYVKSSWSMSNFINFVYNVQWGLCKIEIGLWYHKI